MNIHKIIQKGILVSIALLLMTGCNLFPSSQSVARPSIPSLMVSTNLSQDSAEEIVDQMISAKLTAMEEKNIEKYMALINDADPEFFTEQRNWFLIYQDAITADFTIEVQSVEIIDEKSITAAIEQHYLYGSDRVDRTVSYTEKYIFTSSGWRDADLNFEVIETPHFVVKYPIEISSKALEVSKEAEIGYASAVKEFGKGLPGKKSIKLYNSQELLRQSSDIRVAYLFNGWAEVGESIKLYALRDREVFAPVIAHELIHNITLDITDSQTSWLSEGLAVYFGNQPFRFGNPLEMNLYTIEELSQPIIWLEENTLIQISDVEMTRLYYAVSGMVVEFIVKAYGLDTLNDLLDELSKNPRYDRGYDYDKMEQENQRRVHAAIEAVLGLDMNAFNQLWLDWLKSLE